MSERPRVLDELGAELDRVARTNLAASGGQRLAPRRMSVAAIAIATVLVLAAAAAAATLLIRQGAPLPAPHAQDLQSSGVPIASSAHLAGLDAADPEPGAPPWDLRLSRTLAGETCTAVGQVVNGKFGIVGLDHVFRALPLGGVDACGVAATEGSTAAASGTPVLAGARIFVGDSPSEARTVVNGVAGPGVRSVTAYGPEGARVLPLGPEGSFIAVYRGYVEEVRPRIAVVDRDGHSHTIAFAQSSAFEVADPGGRSPWEVSGGAGGGPGAFPDEDCAQASQQVGRTDPSRSEAALTPVVCGRLGAHPLFVTMRRFVPGEGAQTGYPWSNNPARTLVYGAAALRVASLTLTGPGVGSGVAGGAPREVPIDPHGGVFIAVLDGHVDPRTLTLTAHLRDGATLRYTRSTNLLAAESNRPLREPPVPAYRNPLPPRAAEPAPPDIPVADSVRQTVRAEDPAGGPPWVLRSWRGRPNPRANFGAGYRPGSFVCTQVGVIEHHHLVQPRPGARPLALELGQDYGVGIGGCNAPSDLARLGPLAQSATYLADPYAYEPRPLSTVVSGMLPADATDPRLLGAGAPRALRTDANHAFLTVLPGRYWDAPLRISARIGGRTVTRSAVEGPGADVPRIPEARAPDPDGGAPWGFAATGDATAYGRIVEGQLGAIDEHTGTLLDGPEGSSSGGSGERRVRPQPVQFDVQSGSEGATPGEPQPAPSRAQIERRTLPGRTIVTGVAEADVVSVTLQTPSDVRTLRPSGRHHALIAVYDGQFFRGAIVATVRLSDGRTVTEQLHTPDAPLGPIAPLFSPAAQLHRDRLTLQNMSSQVARVEHASGAQRRRLLRGVPLPQLVRGLRQLRAIVAEEEARIAYVRTHPGVLPAE